MSQRLAVLILTCNEEKNIADCIGSAQFADEIVIVDSGSTDHTCEIAAKLGARVCRRAMGEDGFAGQRNFALAQTTADWVFYLDADERMTPEAGAEVRRLVEQNEPAAYEIKRMNIVFGQMMKYGGHGPDWSMRLYPRTAVQWHGVVHEHVDMKLPIHQMKAVMHHYTYTDWHRYFVKFNQYTTLMAEKMKEEGKTASFAAIVFHPPYAFFRFYILQRGFLEGKLGFIFAMFHGFYTLAKYVKLYYIQDTEKKV